MRSISASTWSISCSTRGESVVLLSSAPGASETMATVIITAANDKIAREVMREPELNGMRSPFAGNGVLARDRFAALSRPRRPPVSWQEGYAILLSGPCQNGCACRQKQYSGSTHDNLNR